MFRQDMVLQGKCKNIKVLFHKPAEVAILSIDSPPDKAGTRTAPRGSFCWASDTSLHFILMQSYETNRRGNMRAREMDVLPKETHTSKRQRWDLKAD